MLEAEEVRQLSPLCDKVIELAKEKLSGIHRDQFCKLVEEIKQLAKERHDAVHALWTTTDAREPLRIRPELTGPKGSKKVDWSKKNQDRPAQNVEESSATGRRRIQSTRAPTKELGLTLEKVRPQPLSLRQFHRSSLRSAVIADWRANRQYHYASVYPMRAGDGQRRAGKANLVPRDLAAEGGAKPCTVFIFDYIDDISCVRMPPCPAPRQ